MDHGDLADDDRGNGMGIVVEYAGQKAKPCGHRQSRFNWIICISQKAGAAALSPDETFEMIFAKGNAAEAGFNRWTIKRRSSPDDPGRRPCLISLEAR